MTNVTIDVSQKVDINVGLKGYAGNVVAPQSIDFARQSGDASVIHSDNSTTATLSSGDVGVSVFVATVVADFGRGIETRTETINLTVVPSPVSFTVGTPSFK